MLTKKENGKRVSEEIIDREIRGIMRYMIELMGELGFEGVGNVSEMSKHNKFKVDWLSKPIVIIGHYMKGYEIYIQGGRTYKVEIEGRDSIRYKYIHNKIIQGEGKGYKELTNKILEGIREAWEESK